MKANRRARTDELAGAETVGALVLFGLFVTLVALLNVTAVPNAGRAAEEAHWDATIAILGGLQSEAEAASAPSAVGATVGRVLSLGPEVDPGEDFFSFFLATPARAAGQLTFTPDYGNITLTHTRQSPPGTVVDIGSTTARFPLGRVTFDPHPNFRSEGLLQLENGALLTTTSSSATLRFDPPVTVGVSGGTTYLTVKARVFNGTAQDLGGTAPVRLHLATEAATLTSPAANNADQVVLRLETSYGSAWGAYLNETATAGGLSGGTQHFVDVASDAGASGLDVVTWTVNGTATGNDVRLTTGLAIHGVSLG